MASGVTRRMPRSVACTRGRVDSCAGAGGGFEADAGGGGSQLATSVLMTSLLKAGTALTSSSAKSRTAADRLSDERQGRQRTASTSEAWTPGERLRIPMAMRRLTASALPKLTISRSTAAGSECRTLTVKETAASAADADMDVVSAIFARR